MNLKTRLLTLLSLMLVASLVGANILRYIHDIEENEELAYQKLDRESRCHQLIPILEYPLDQFTRDYSQWDELLNFASKPDPEWARINIDNSLSNFRLTAAWILSPQGQIIHASKEAQEKTLPPFPDTDGSLIAKLQRQPFEASYALLEGKAYALRAMPIQPSADIRRKAPPAGWLIAIRRLDDAHLQQLGELNNAKAELLLQPPEPTTTQTDPRHSIIHIPLRDHRDRNVATLRLAFTPQTHASDANLHEMLLLVALGLVLTSTVFIALHFWILHPFKLIAESLVSGQPDTLKPIVGNRTEIGHIARLVRIHFANQRAMSETMEARAQLARDLHDGVIQSIYAAGMGVAAAQALIKTDPEAASNQLLQIRTQLNDTIREARGFISGLDSGSTEGEPYSAVVENLVESMSWIRQVKTTVTIDDAAAQSLTQQSREQALQMIREALSNSLRHSQATEISIALQQNQAKIALTIADNGSGFDLAHKKPGGHGLANLTERASLVDGRAIIESAPGKGTCVRIEFPTTKPAPA